MQMCPYCDHVYDESDYGECPYCSGELDGSNIGAKAKGCPKCNSIMYWDEYWFCSNCDCEIYTDEDDYDFIIE